MTNPHDQPNHPDAVAWLEEDWETAWWTGGPTIVRAMVELVDDRPDTPNTTARWPRPADTDRLPNTSQLDCVIGESA